ncbi:hypothetical protein NIES2100_42230 [Calothrix sp. NIES-2100]|uniref:AAA family ATPase n=1 Tax=Calothrix sp. NIES-2100 TaxID=1954172 RepID=UPI000B5E1A86|nr:hypothetical protein NIES2100_42230 [Calothrix sp. NIES-2100]
MEQNLGKLQTNLQSLGKSFLQLGEQLSEAKLQLESNLIAPSPALVEQIISEQRRFAELRSQVVELAQSLDISTADINNIISLKELETILKSVAEAEQTVSKTNRQALDILKDISRIAYSDRSDFPPLQQCIAQARDLENLILNSPENSLHPEAKALVSGEHPLVQLLTLISVRESPDFQQLADLQTGVAQSLGMPIAMAALTGKLIFSSAEKSEAITAVILESELIAPATNVDTIVAELEIVEVTKVAEIPRDTAQEIVVNHIPIPTPIQPQTYVQEIATSILNSNLESSQNALQDLIWQLIYENKVSLAFNLARCLEIEFPHIQFQLPAWVIRAVVLGSQIRYEVGIGEIANILRDDFANFSDRPFNGNSEWNQEISLLLAASALRPALLAPNTDASQILLFLRLGEGLNQLYEYCQIIGRYGAQRIALNTKAIKKVKSQEEWNKEIAALNQEVDFWYSQASAIPLKTQARKIWKKWLESDGFIYELLSQIREKDTAVIRNITLNDVQEIQQKIQRLYIKDEIKRKIDLTKESLDANKKRAIDKDDIPKLCRYVHQVLDFCRRWIELQELRLEQNSNSTERQAKLAEQIKQELSGLHNAVLQELNIFESRNSSVFMRTGISICRAAVRDICDLFAPDTPLATVEPEPKYLIYGDLLRIPAVTLNVNWEPEIGENSLVQGILNLVAQNNFNWLQNFLVQSESKNHEATERIIEYLRVYPEADIDVEELLRMREDSLKECRDSLVRDIKDTRNQIEQAVALGILKEADRFDYAAKIANIEKEVETVLRFDIKHEKLEEIKAAIAQKKAAAIEQVRQRLNALSLTSEQPSYVRIQELLNQGNVLTANEYIDMIDRGDEIPPVEIAANDFSDFFPLKVTEIDKFMEENSPNLLISKVQRREDFCGINFRRLSGSATERAAKMLNAWFSAKKAGKFQQILESDAGIILVNLGFNPSRITIERVGGRTWLQITTEIIRNKELCPVATYGSAAHGQYRILCVWDRPTAEDILNAVGETSHGSPAFVFFFGRLTELRRRDLARLCRERRRTFVLIDDILMLYICGAEEPRLRTLFKCALPFTFLETHATTAGLVPPEIFYGRKQERDSVINSMGSCFIYGGRQLGKTALLRSVEREFHAPQERRIALFLDLKADGIGIHRPIEDIWSLLADEFKKLEVVPRMSPTNIGAETLLRHLQNWLEQDKSRRILLLLDEADKFLESDGQNKFSQTSRFKGLMDKTDRRFKVVFAGLHNVQRTTRVENHPLAHYGEPLCIGPLLENKEWREARELIKRPLANIGYELSDDLVTRILSQTNYYPSLIQLYCHELLRDVNNNHLKKYDRNNTPPYEIADKQVDETYQSNNLRKAIRDRLLWTLQLDQRYEVIAYSIAYESLTSPKGMVDGFSVSWIQDAVLSWWSEGFQGKSTDEFRALLEEMVGLGVLRETNEGGFALRSPNVVLLLGTEAEIEEQLLRSREPALGYDAEIFRSALRHDLSRRSPLTVQQESALRRRENGVSIIFGCPAAGLNELQDFLISAVGKEFWIPIENVAGESDFTKHLANLDKREMGIDGTTIMFVSSTCDWSQEWVKIALEKVQRLKSKKSFARVVFVANPPKVWELINLNCLDSLVSQGVSIFSLKPWHDAALRQWLEDDNFTAANKESREKITEITGNWPVLLQRFYQQAKSDQHWEPHLQKLADSLTNSEYLNELAILMGLDNTHPQQKQILHALATLKEAAIADLIEIVEDISAEIVHQTFKWAELLRLAYPVGNSNWSIDPLVGRIVTSLGA